MYGRKRQASHRCCLLWQPHNVGYDPPVTHGTEGAST
jgi:hypothetical protein